MTEIRLDPYTARYAGRTRGMAASEIRALFAVASRPEIVSLAGGMPYTAALDYEAVSEVTGAVLRDSGPDALQYGGGQGLASLREQLVQVMHAESIDAHADDLVVTSGGQQALDLLAKLLCDPGDVILAEGPSYVGALGAFSAYQANIVHVPMDADGLIPEALEAVLDRLEAQGRVPKFLYTVPNHQNPAGVCLSTERRHHVVEVARRHDLLVIEDNPYGLLDFKGRLLPALRTLAPERVLYVGTLSKVFSPGVRTGWVAAPSPIRDKLILLKEAADLCQSNLTQYVAGTWLETQPWESQVEAFRGVYRERCDALVTELTAELPDGCSWSEPTGGFFVWLHVPAGVDTTRMLPKALGARVAYVPGRGFYADGSGAREMRLSFCFPPAARIRDGVRRLAEVLRRELEIVHAVYGDEVPDEGSEGAASA